MRNFWDGCINGLYCMASFFVYSFVVIIELIPLLFPLYLILIKQYTVLWLFSYIVIIPCLFGINNVIKNLQLRGNKNEV